MDVLPLEMGHEDLEISRLLGTWRHVPPSAPRFNAEVWARIDAVRDVSWAIASQVTRALGLPGRCVRWVIPVGAALLVAFAAFVGAGAGYLQTSLTRTERMADAYVKTIDPLQMIVAPGRGR